MNSINYLEDIKNRMTHDNYLPGNGWHDLIIDLHKKLVMLDPDYKIIQIKEKFGSLRYYYTTEVTQSAVKEAMQRYVAQAETLSKNICESCGGKSEIRKTKSGWLKAFCYECLISQALDGMGM